MIDPIRSAWRLLNLPCSEVARLASESLDRDLPFSSRVALKTHLAYCSACRRYLRIALQLRDAMRLLDSRATEDESDLSEEARDRIKKALHEG